jgi:hypothetical protein
VSIGLLHATLLPRGARRSVSSFYETTFLTVP